jgi:hypothetical protein
MGLRYGKNPYRPKIGVGETGDYGGENREPSDGKTGNRGKGKPGPRKGKPGTAKGKLEDLAQAVDLIVVRLVEELVLLSDLFFHEQARIAVGGDIADRKINTSFDDHLVAADIRHVDLVVPAIGCGALIFASDGIEKDVIGLFRKGEETQLRVVKKAVDKMELDQRFLAKQLRPVEQYLMVFDIIDVFYLEGRHSDLPDHPARSGSELDIVWCDQGFAEIWIQLFL